jgi:nicotinamide-nucleotide amidase
VIARCAAAGLTVAVAESLTGGALMAQLVDVPGASAVLRGGVVAYATELKASLLGVDEALLSRLGAVDALVARQMADGVRRRLGADLGVATTGVAGPADADGHPPGTVHVALAWEGGTQVRSVHIPGGRGAVRAGAAHVALALVLAWLDKQFSSSPGG